MSSSRRCRSVCKVRSVSRALCGNDEDAILAFIDSFRLQSGTNSFAKPVRQQIRLGALRLPLRVEVRRGEVQEGRCRDAASEADEDDEEEETDKLCDCESLFEADLRVSRSVSD